MKLEKAIEIKVIYHAYHSQFMTPDERSADNLSIEAMKWIVFHRRISPDHIVKKLPGETED